MKAKEKMTEKRMYICPEIISVVLDSEISLALESIPPFGPDESISNAPEYFKNDPFNSNRA